MTNILPEGESLRKAVAWLSQGTGINFAKVQEASSRFDLSPKDEAFLIRQFLQNKSSGEKT